MYKYTIYLLKDTVTDPNDCLTDKALNSFPASAKEIEFAETHEYDDIEGFAFFNDATPPKWSAAFEQAAILPNEIDTNSSGALVFAKEAGRWFAISFGIGHFSLDKRKVDMSFGLRCVINMLKDENVSSRRVLRSLLHSVERFRLLQLLRSVILELLEKLRSSNELADAMILEGRFPGRPHLNLQAKNQLPSYQRICLAC